METKDATLKEALQIALHNSNGLFHFFAGLAEVLREEGKIEDDKARKENYAGSEFGEYARKMASSIEDKIYTGFLPEWV